MYASFFNNPTFSDITLHIDKSRSLNLHRIVLARQSEHFAKMFADKTQVRQRQNASAISLTGIEFLFQKQAKDVWNLHLGNDVYPDVPELVFMWAYEEATPDPTQPTDKLLQCFLFANFCMLNAVKAAICSVLAARTTNTRQVANIVSVPNTLGQNAYYKDIYEKTVSYLVEMYSDFNAAWMNTENRDLFATLPETVVARILEHVAPNTSQNTLLCAIYTWRDARRRTSTTLMKYVSYDGLSTSFRDVIDKSQVFRKNASQTLQQPRSRFVAMFPMRDIRLALSRHWSSPKNEPFYLLTQSHLHNGFEFKIKLTVNPSGIREYPVNIHVGLGWRAACGSIQPRQCLTTFTMSTFWHGEDVSGDPHNPVRIASGTCFGWDDFFGSIIYASSNPNLVDRIMEGLEEFSDDGEHVPIQCDIYSAE